MTSEVPHFELGATPTDADIAAVTEFLGRKPQGQFSVVVRRADNLPAVLRNAPLMFDGTPMPTLYWLVDPELVKEVGHVESTGGVNEVEAELPTDVIEAIHNSYRDERDALFETDAGKTWTGHKPTGGVGGTRVGVKCLHAHYANFLAGNQDAVADWLVKKLRVIRKQNDATKHDS